MIIAGFEAFNLPLYRNAAKSVTDSMPETPVAVFTDADIINKPEEVQAALDSADAVLLSLIFDYNQVEWLRRMISKIPTRFCFESALELMSETSVGSFQMKGPSPGVAAGPPAPVKAILQKFGSKKEEDKMTGYLNFLKVGPQLLKWVPGDKVKDIRLWLTVYAYWNQGGEQNIVSMLYTIINELDLPSKRSRGVSDAHTTETGSVATHSIVPRPILESPAIGLYHPALPPGEYILSPKEYAKWFEQRNRWVHSGTPRVGLLLYRKHVISEQAYIGNLITLMESEGIMPIPVFINGVEAHTVVRDLFTTKSEAKGGQMGDWTLSSECTEVDAIVNTIGFPLVGGPAGSMEGGRQIEVSQQILSVKNIPYIVAAPLLIQDTKSWLEKGVQGLQTVVLFSLPELDGAVDTLVLGGLVDGERITIIPERVRKLTKRLKAWVQLRKKRVEERKVALMVYGFPPNVGAVATAALLNVGSSIRNLLLNLAAEGYFLGEGSFLSSFKRGDQLVKALRLLTQETLSSRNLESVRTAIKRQCGLEDVEIVLKEVPFRDLKSWLGKAMTLRMEKQWGDLEAYTGIGTSKTGLFQVVGLQVGNIFIGIQPALGVEGDPMRLLFERDMTPHPQYAAYYRHIQMEVQPDSIVHFGKERERDSTPSHPLIVVRTIYISIA